MRDSYFPFGTVALGTLTLTLLCGCARSSSSTRPANVSSSAPANVQVVRPPIGEITRSITFPAGTTAYQQATLSGTVTRRLVDPGAFIPAATSGSAAQNAALMTLMDFTRVRVQVAVPELEVPFIRSGLPVKVTVDELANRVFEGEVTRFAYALDETTKTMLSEIEIPNPKGELRPGMFATVRIVAEQKNDALLIPAEALVIEKIRNSVFAIVDGKAKKVPVKTGFNDGVSVEILEGLRSGEPVVLVGKQTINDGQVVRVARSEE